MESDLHGGTRIAVLIDADNTSPKYAEALLEEVAKYGTPTIKRAYGDFSSQRLSGWTRELNARAIRSMHQIAFTTGKNSTDSALIIDAMDLLYADNVEAFAIVSSDSDFTSLALRLRESGKKVYGLGRKTTPSSLQNACDRFIALEVLMTETQDEEPEDKSGEEKEVQDAPSLNLQSALTKAVNAVADEEGWVTVSQIGNHLTRTHASFDPRNFGHSKLTALLQAQPYLETRGDAKRLEVRLKAPRKTAAEKPPAAKKAPAAAKKVAAKKAPAKTPEQEPAEVPTVKVTTRTRPARNVTPTA
ncbi:NYN domain-containing protein [Nocardioides sp.]|uniref:NYN domain-containing protein n=1 Tax=Nocardioides sp. TaxID=35761 RepID=UPI00286DF49C|nr:NYN domain-containing protein [Nocardioides sp.]